MATDTERKASRKIGKTRPPRFRSYAYQAVEHGEGLDRKVVIRCELDLKQSIEIELYANLANTLGKDLVDRGIKRGDLEL